MITWGNYAGGDCSDAEAQLKNVQQVKATECAFAAILAEQIHQD